MVSSHPVGLFEELESLVEPIDIFTEDLLPWLATNQFALIRGSCQSGKTSLANRAVYYSKMVDPLIVRTDDFRLAEALRNTI